MLIGGPSSVQSWELINLAVCSLVTAGLYQEALHDAWPTDSLEKAESKDRHGIGIVQVNRAEALHNLGRDTEAHALLDKVEHLVVDYPLALHGLRCLRAWIHVHEGELEKARSVLANVDHVALAPDYVAEVEYTWAALGREAGSYAKAQGHAAKGLDLSVRTSSKRNGLFMLASVAAQSGDAPAAIQWFEQAMAHPYKGQSRYSFNRILHKSILPNAPAYY
jgi:tetratricopeptide (TPR) repeat protein